ncbi:MAG: nodulation protein [Burkholderiales bacterium]|jgi:acyl carrier protein
MYSNRDSAAVESKNKTYRKSQLNTPEIVAKLKGVLNEQFGIDTTEFDESTRLGDIGIDSLHIVDIMLDLENDLNFSFQDLSLPPNPSLGDMAEAIQKNMAA